MLWNKVRRSIPYKVIAQEILPRKYHVRGGISKVRLRDILLYYRATVSERNRRKPTVGATNGVDTKPLEQSTIPAR